MLICPKRGKITSKEGLRSSVPPFEIVWENSKRNIVGNSRLRVRTSHSIPLSTFYSN